MTQTDRIKAEYEAKITEALGKLMHGNHPDLPAADDFRFAGWDEYGHAVICLQSLTATSANGVNGQTGIGNIRLIGPPEEILKLLAEFRLIATSASLSRCERFERRRAYK